MVQEIQLLLRWDESFGLVWFGLVRSVTVFQIYYCAWRLWKVLIISRILFFQSTLLDDNFAAGIWQKIWRSAVVIPWFLSRVFQPSVEVPSQYQYISDHTNAEQISLIQNPIRSIPIPTQLQCTKLHINSNWSCQSKIMAEDVLTMQVWIKSFWCQSNAINKLQNSNFRNYQWWLPNNLPKVMRLNCHQKKINWNMNLCAN